VTNLQQMSHAWLACALHAQARGVPQPIVDELRARARLAQDTSVRLELASLETQELEVAAPRTRG
jgi:hypothetical protein